MTLRIVLSACVRGLRHSYLVDQQIIMTKKKRFVHLPISSKVMAARFCSNGTAVAEMPLSEIEGESIPESTTETTDSPETVSTKVSQEENVKFLIVGLGNPEGLGTRHSVGMNFVNSLARKLGADWTREQFKKTGGFSASVTVDNIEIHLLKPRVPMNLNGTSVNKSAHFFSICPENIYLIHDELDKPVGKFQIKESGSASGHNGVKSVMNSLKTDVMPRVRIGIDRPSNQDEVIDYVLERFEDDEFRLIKTVMAEAMQHLFKHIGEKCGRQIDLDQISQERQKLQSFKDREEYRFGQSSGFKKTRKDYGYKDHGFHKKDRSVHRFKERRNTRKDFDFKERDDFSFDEDDLDFEVSDRRDFRMRDRRDFRSRDNHDFRNKKFTDRSSFFGDPTDFDYADNENDVKQKRRNPVYYNDE